jgi:hypothetical protein
MRRADRGHPIQWLDDAIQRGIHLYDYFSHGVLLVLRTVTRCIIPQQKGIVLYDNAIYSGLLMRAICAGVCPVKRFSARVICD